MDAIGASLDNAGIVYRSQPGVAGDWELRLALMRALRVIEGMDADSATGSSVALGPVEADALFKHSHKSMMSGSGALAGEIQSAVADGEAVSLNTWARHVRSSWWDAYAAGRESISELTKYAVLTDRDFDAMRAAWDRYENASEWTVSALYDGTKLWTIHAAKGDESTDVVLYDGLTRRIKRSVDEHSDLAANEARTWYVALTRSSSDLHIVRDAFKSGYSRLDDDLAQRASFIAERQRDLTGDTGVSADD